MRILTALAAALLLAGCARDATVSTETADRGTAGVAQPGADSQRPADPAPRTASADGWLSIGEPASADLPAVDVAELLAQPEAYNGRTLQLRGTISEVCQSKGCWLRIADPSGSPETVFVKFTCPSDGDYLIPPDSAGKVVEVQGEVVVEEMSEGEARHYAQDAGKTQAEIEAIIGPQKVVRVMSPSARVRV